MESYFYLFLSFSTITLDYIKKKKVVKDTEKKVNWPRTMVLRKEVIGTIAEFSFCLMHSMFGTEEKPSILTN